MSRSEYIVWRVETENQIQEEHPTWKKEQVKKYADKVEKKLRNMGYLE